MAHPKFHEVRSRYQSRCGYCGISEIDAGGELTVDHFRPVSAGGGNSDDNLVYSCVRCNLYKSSYWPEGQDIDAGNAVLHPIFDDAEQHIRLNEETGELAALTQRGRFHIGLLDLNRPQLVAYRQRLRLQQLLDEIRQSFEIEVANLEEEVRAYSRYASDLEQMLGMRFE